jgi:hypothetical protein
VSKRGVIKTTNVLALPRVEIFDAHEHLVFFQPELDIVAAGEKCWVFLVPRTNVVDHMLGFEDTFRHRTSCVHLASGIGAEHLADKTLVVVFRGAARNRIDL